MHIEVPLRIHLLENFSNFESLMFMQLSGACSVKHSGLLSSFSSTDWNASAYLISANSIGSVEKILSGLSLPIQCTKSPTVSIQVEQTGAKESTLFIRFFNP